MLTHVFCDMINRQEHINRYILEWEDILFNNKLLGSMLKYLNKLFDSFILFIDSAICAGANVTCWSTSECQDIFMCSITFFSVPIYKLMQCADGYSTEGVLTLKTFFQSILAQKCVLLLSNILAIKTCRV